MCRLPRQVRQKSDEATALFASTKSKQWWMTGLPACGCRRRLPPRGNAPAAVGRGASRMSAACRRGVSAVGIVGPPGSRQDDVSLTRSAVLQRSSSSSRKSRVHLSRETNPLPGYIIPHLPRSFLQLHLSQFSQRRLLATVFRPWPSPILTFTTPPPPPAAALTGRSAACGGSAVWWRSSRRPGSTSSAAASPCSSAGTTTPSPIERRRALFFSLGVRRTGGRRSQFSHLGKRQRRRRRSTVSICRRSVEDESALCSPVHKKKLWE